jgi:putative drug exporter of the RND superfamily
MRSWAGFVYRHRKLVLAVWLIALIGCGFLAKSWGTQYSSSFNLPNTESTHALGVLSEKFPSQAGASLQLVFHAKTGTVTDSTNKPEIEALLTKIEATPHVDTVQGPFDATAAGQISKDESVAYANVIFDQRYPTPAVVSPVIDTALAANSATLQVEAGGPLVQQSQSQPPSSEALGLLAAALILLITFGSLVAMTLPLISAVVALGTAISVIGMISHGVQIAEFGPTLATLIGLGVGIDYALFIVSRFRQTLHDGESVENSVIMSLDSSGRAVVFAGVTVCIALLGLFLLHVSFLYGIAISASIAVAFTMLSAVTLLPAILGMLGPRVDKGKVPFRNIDANEHPGWARWAAQIKRRPWVFAIVGLLVVLTLAIPALSMRLGSSDAGTAPKSDTTRRAYDLLADGFGPGFNGPFTVTVELPKGKDADAAAVSNLDARLRAADGVAAVSPPIYSKDGTAAIIQVVPTTGPQAAATTELLKYLRNQVIPSAVAGSDVVVSVGGVTAIFEDFSQVLQQKLPLFIGVVVLVSMLLLMMVFRSLVIPVKAAVMNLLSILAAFGVVVAVFQWGWGASLIGIDATGPIEAFLPVMLFAILFGLSMDYEVFLVSRMHEEWLRKKDNDYAVETGLTKTGGVITAAATIMIVVFASFILGGERVIKLFGLGFACAVFIDAFIIRSAIVPGVMFIIGKANWYLPKWLDRILPQLSIEPKEEHGEPEEKEPVAVG